MTNSYDLLKVNTGSFVRKSLSLLDFENATKKYLGVEKQVLSLKNKPNGISQFLYDDFGQKITIEFSSKILKSRCKELISVGNISDVVDIINGYGIVEIIKDQFIFSSEVHKCHVTKDIHLSTPVDKVLALLSRCQIHKKYRHDYDKYAGIFIKPKSKNNKTALKAYSKFEELTKNKSKTNKLLLAEIDLADFENTVRVEVELCDFEKMRKYLNLPGNYPPYLENVLNSDSDVVASMLKKIIVDPSDSKLRKTLLPGFKLNSYDAIFAPLYKDFGNSDYRVIKYIKGMYKSEQYSIVNKYLDWKATKKLIVLSDEIDLHEFFEKAGAL